MKIGEKIRERRKELKWSQRELADRMGYNHSTITRIENGMIDIPQSRILQFADVMGVSIAYLMNWEEVQKNNDTITDAVVKMRTDDEFFSLIECLLLLDDEKRSIVKQMASALQK